MEGHTNCLGHRAIGHHEVAEKIALESLAERMSPGEKRIAIAIHELAATIALAADELTRLLGVAMSLHFGDGVNPVIDNILRQTPDEQERG